jgi:hypothetical protein
MAVTTPGADSAPLVPRTAMLASPRAARRRLPVGVVGLVFVVGGAVLQAIALVSSRWLDAAAVPKTGKIAAMPAVRMKFADFGAHTQRGFAHVYFAWGAWVLFAVMLGLGVTACVRWRGARAFRIAGALWGVIGAGATIAGLLVFAYQTDVEAFHIARNYSAGVYLAMLGLLASAFGAAAGEVGT